ncbi:MAG: translational machinery protein [Steroidobacteraceae bacterium]
MSHFHAVVWVDHQKATVWQFTPTEQENTVVHAHGQPRVHSRKSTHGGHKSPIDHLFFEEVAHALSGAQEILIIGPAQTKQELANFLRAKHAALGRGIVAVENADHPTDPEVLAYARRHFAAIDRMFSPQRQ